MIHKIQKENYSIYQKKKKYDDFECSLVDTINNIEDYNKNFIYNNSI